MAAGNPSPSTLDVSATVSADGGAEITERGFVYSSKGTPSVEECEKRIVMEGTVGDMSTTLTGLTGYTNYSIRAYAINKMGRLTAPPPQLERRKQIRALTIRHSREQER